MVKGSEGETLFVKLCSNLKMLEDSLRESLSLHATVEDEGVNNIWPEA
jgi:hypothetical protein